ncbi:MAG: PH domain-containing protein [Candidatus Micrarchaeia archaeon]
MLIGEDMSENFTKHEKEILSKIMEAGEEVIAVGKQHRLSKLIAPAIALSTDRRLIIFKRDVLGIRTDMHFIPYDSIVSFRVLHGFVFSSIKLRLLGAVKPEEHAVTNMNEDETEVRGLTKTMARFLAVKISENVSKRSAEKNSAKHETVIKQTTSTPVVNIFFNTNIVTPHGLVPGMYLPSQNNYPFYEPEPATRSNRQEQGQTSKAKEVAEECADCTEEVAYELEPHSNDLEYSKKGIEVNEIVRRESPAQEATYKGTTQQASVGESAKESTDQNPMPKGTIDPSDLMIFKNRKSGQGHISSIGFLRSLFSGKHANSGDDFIDEITRKRLSED